MIKRNSFVFSLFFVVAVLVGVVAAQAPTPAVPTVPKDELVQAWIETVKVAAQYANNDCQHLESVKQFNSLRIATQQKVEARLPGFTVDWSRFTVTAKKVAENK